MYDLTKYESIRDLVYEPISDTALQEYVEILKVGAVRRGYKDYDPTLELHAKPIANLYARPVAKNKLSWPLWMVGTVGLTNYTRSVYGLVTGKAMPRGVVFVSPETAFILEYGLHQIQK